MSSFWGTTKPFSKVTESSYNPIRDVLRFQFLHIIASICYCLFLFLAILVSMKWYLHVIF